MRSAKNVLATAGHTPSTETMGDATPSADAPMLPAPVPAPVRADSATSRSRRTQAMPRRKPGPRAGTAQAKNGGLSVRERYGNDFYRRIGQKGGAAVRDRRGPRYFSDIGRRGGEATLQRLGAEHFERIGRLSAERTRSTR
jgi:general stress protein YciG